MTRFWASLPLRAAFFAVLFLLTFCGIVRAAYPWENLELRGAVNDYAGLLGGEERARLEESLVQYNRQSGNALVLVTLGDLAGGDIDDAANRIFAKAGIGEKGKDNGVLLLICLNDRKMRIEVGYGLEGVLTDAQCAGIISRDLRPAFREGHYYAGIDAAFRDMRTLIGGGALSAETNAGDEGAKPFPFAPVIFIIVVIIMGLFSSKKGATRGSRRFISSSGFGGGFHSGGGGGGFGGFGGGHSGGGGAHGGW